jgi:photosystem II stability/assembly factor-like uncharacterized protein
MWQFVRGFKRPVWQHTLAVLLVAVTLPTAAQQIAPSQYEQLRFRHIGPVGNRVASVTGVPGDPLTYYAGAASGGIWKSVDGGEYWEPMFDGQPDHAIGALAVAPSDPQIVWAGTGEPHIRSNVSIGTAVYKSTDGGRTWRRMGLEWPSRTAAIVIHPTNPDVVYVGALGHAHGPQSERGVYRTKDGGQMWEHVLFVDENTGVSSLVMDPHNPRILFAGMWQVEVHTWGRESGGPGSGIYMSRDGGDTWRKLEGHGLPRLPVGKVGLCMTPATSDRIYALIETGDGVPWHGQETESGEVWRSDDGGSSWQLMTHDRNFGGRTAYYNNCAVTPDDPDEAFFLTAAFVHTIDGAKTGTSLSGRRRPGGDYHSMWIDPTNGDRMIVGNDGGVGISVNRGRTWHRVQLPIAQMYHVTVDDAIPYNVMGNRQDGPSARGPSNSRTGASIPRGMWHSVGGGESGFATPDPTDPNIVWSSASGSGARGGIVVRFNEQTRQYRQVEVWPETTGGWPAADLRYRFQWTFPLLISPHDANTVYVTSQYVHRTTNGGQRWEVISPDLTTNDKSKQGVSGGLTPDNIGVEYCCVVYAFDESPAQAGVLWAGSNDGLVHVSRDNGANWTDVTGNLPDLPPDGVVRNIHASKYDPAKAYLTIEHHQQGNFAPHVYKTSNYGQTWTKIVNGIADSPLSYARDVTEDPVRPGLLYLGTENALYVSLDDGARWQPLMTNLPSTPVYWLVVQEHFDDLVVGTYGRGFWILDDITPLQQLTADVVASDAHLFAPRAAYRFHEITSPMDMPNDPSDGENPPYGASINYWVRSAQGGGATLRIDDASGKMIRTIHGPSQSGINRVWWDLRTERSTQIRMRTKPLYAEWVELGDDRWRPAGGNISILAPPGAYTVTLEIGDRQFTQQLDVRKDPNSEGSLEDIRAQNEMLEDIRRDFNATADMINRIEWIRRQLDDLSDVLNDQGGRDDIVAAAANLDSTFVSLEENLIQLRLTGTGQDGVRWPAKLQGRLSYLASAVATADFRPTDQEVEVHQLLKERLAQYRAGLARLLQTDFEAFNARLRASNLSPIIDGDGGP